MGRKQGGNPGHRMMEAALERQRVALNHEHFEKSKVFQIQYHQAFIGPIEKRLRHLEKPFHQRWSIDVWRMIQRSWVKLTFLFSWRITEEHIRKTGWRRRWYHGLVRRTDEDDGFIFVLRPFHWLAQLYGVWQKFRQRRQDRRKAAELAAKIAAEEAAKAEEPTEGPEEPVLKAVPDDA